MSSIRLSTLLSLVFVSVLPACDRPGHAESEAGDVPVLEEAPELSEREVADRAQPPSPAATRPAPRTPPAAQDRVRVEDEGEVADGDAGGRALPRTDTSPPPPIEPTIRPELATPSIPAGTSMTLILEQGLSTRTSQVGQTFYARVAEEVLAGDGMVLVPEGTRVRGRVTQAAASTSADEQAVLAFALESLLLDEGEREIVATVTETQTVAEAGDSRTRSAATVATGAAAGALVGRILGGDRRSTVGGAAVGAAAGTAVAIATREGHAQVDEGSRLVVRLEQAVLLP